MNKPANVRVHCSQFPGQVRRDLLQSLRTRRVQHKFHYDSLKQTQKWLELHQACSPSRNDPGCAAIYDQSFRAVVENAATTPVHLIGLGCGGGQKDARLLSLLQQAGRKVIYAPCDVSVAMVLVAREAALTADPDAPCTPMVFDLGTTDDLPEVFEKETPADFMRILTFFGMIPNFEPGLILAKLARLVRPGDWLLFSANLAPGADYAEGLRRVLPQYDNALTRDWLITFLLDLGVERDDGQLRFEVECDPVRQDIQRIAAYFHFVRDRQISLGSDRLEFMAGEAIRLFFSYRYTSGMIRELLAEAGLPVRAEFVAASEEEGVFLCERAVA